MFGEVGRVLGAGGAYLCVTLAEPYICRALLGHYGRRGWGIAVEVVPSAAPSPFQTFFVALTKPATEATPASALSPAGAGAVAVSAALLYFDALGRDTSVPRALPAVPEGAAEVIRVQQYHRKQYEVRAGRVRVGVGVGPLSLSPPCSVFRYLPVRAPIL